MTTATIHAIETEYAGCRFRSRLEARWAVFFDALGFEWVYEPQGYHLNGASYLPDFWLPDLDIWAEVKGQMDPGGLDKLLAAVDADGLPTRYGDPARPCDRFDVDDWHPMFHMHRILLLGEIPVPSYADGYLHTVLSLHGHKGFVCAAGLWTLWGVEGKKNHALVDIDRPRPLTEGTAPQLRLDGYRLAMVKARRVVEDAFKAARSARFEHGQNG